MNHDETYNLEDDFISFCITRSKHDCSIIQLEVHSAQQHWHQHTHPTQ